MSPDPSNLDAVTRRLTQLAEELLDAHCDTVCIASEVATAPDWIAHVEYLKDLQRVGQRTLADLAGSGATADRS